MSVEYECCYCHEVFPADRRIDGFAQGFRVGFLCPCCGRNIRDSPIAVVRMGACQSRWLNRLFWLSVPAFVAMGYHPTIEILGHEVSLGWVILLVYLLLVGLLLLLVPCTRETGVVVTEPVDAA